MLRWWQSPPAGCGRSSPQGRSPPLPAVPAARPKKRPPVSRLVATWPCRVIGRNKGPVSMADADSDPSSTDTLAGGEHCAGKVRQDCLLRRGQPGQGQLALAGEHVQRPAGNPADHHLGR